MARVHADPALVSDLRALTWEALQIEIGTRRIWMESVEQTRAGRRAIEANPDGIDLSGQLIEVLNLIGLLSPEAQAASNGQAARTMLRIYDNILTAMPAFVVIATRGNSRLDQIGDWRDWLRLNLTARALGLALHPVSLALQEYPEMVDAYPRAQDLVAQPGETLQMLGRLAYGPEVSRSPRWPFEARMMHG